MNTEPSSIPAVDERPANDDRERALSLVPPPLPPEEEEAAALLAGERTQRVRERLLELAEPVILREATIVARQRIRGSMSSTMSKREKRTFAGQLSRFEREIAQECRIRIWKYTETAPAHIRWRSQVGQHLKYAVAEWRVTDVGGRKLRRGGPHMVSLDQSNTESGATLQDCLISEDYEDDDGTFRPDGGQDDAIDLQLLLGHLSDDQRQAIILVRLEGRSIAEAAELLGTSWSTTQRLVKDGLAELQQIARTEA